MWLSKVLSIILVHILFINICLAKSGDFNFDRSQFVVIGKVGPDDKFEFIHQGLLIHPQAVITVSVDSLFEAESLEIKTGVSKMHHNPRSDIARSVKVNNIVELPETSKIVLLILEEEILNVKLINYEYTSYDDQYNECKLIKLGYGELNLGAGDIISTLGIKEKKIQLLSHMPDKGCPSNLNRIVDFKSSLFTDYVYCIKEIKKRNCRNDYLGASLVCQDRKTSEFYLAGIVIGKSRCYWMLINTPKLHASIRDQLKTIE